MKRVTLVLSLITAFSLVFASPTLAAPPANDDRSSATVVPGLPFADAINTSEATTASDDPDCVGQGPTVWYSFTPSETTFIGANTFGSNYDTTLSAYVQVDGDLVQIACNDDSGGGVQSRIRFEAEAGVTYLFMVGAFASGPGGNLSFQIIVAPPPVQIDLVISRTGSVDQRTGFATIRGTVTCSGATDVFVDAFLRQRVGRRFINGFGFVFVPCDGTTQWSMEVVGENGLFAGGSAEAQVSAFAPEDDSFDFEVATVRLSRARVR